MKKYFIIIYWLITEKFYYTTILIYYKYFIYVNSLCYEIVKWIVCPSQLRGRIPLNNNNRKVSNGITLVLDSRLLCKKPNLQKNRARFKNFIGLLAFERFVRHFLLVLPYVTSLLLTTFKNFNKHPLGMRTSKK